jgi:hypothetical protein
MQGNEAGRETTAIVEAIVSVTDSEHRLMRLIQTNAAHDSLMCGKCWAPFNVINLVNDNSVILLDWLRGIFNCIQCMHTLNLS